MTAREKRTGLLADLSGYGLGLGNRSIQDAQTGVRRW